MRGISQTKEKIHFPGVGMEGVTVERVVKLGYDGHTGFRRVEEDGPGMRNGVGKTWRWERK